MIAMVEHKRSESELNEPWMNKEEYKRMRSEDELTRHAATLPDGVDARGVPGRPDPRRRATVARWRTLVHPAGIATILATVTLIALGLLILWLGIK